MNIKIQFSNQSPEDLLYIKNMPTLESDLQKLIALPSSDITELCKIAELLKVHIHFPLVEYWSKHCIRTLLKPQLKRINAFIKQIYNNKEEFIIYV